MERFYDDVGRGGYNEKPLTDGADNCEGFYPDNRIVTCACCGVKNSQRYDCPFSTKSLSENASTATMTRYDFRKYGKDPTPKIVDTRDPEQLVGYVHSITSRLFTIVGYGPPINGAERAAFDVHVQKRMLESEEVRKEYGVLAISPIRLEPESNKSRLTKPLHLYHPGEPRRLWMQYAFHVPPYINNESGRTHIGKTFAKMLQDFTARPESESRIVFRYVYERECFDYVEHPIVTRYHINDAITILSRIYSLDGSISVQDEIMGVSVQDILVAYFGVSVDTQAMITEWMKESKVSSS